MASAKDIKRRISSVKNTAQITKAMQMVSASKMQKAQDRAGRAIPYSQGIYEIVNKIGNVSGYESVFLHKAPEVKKVALVVIGTGRGFVGSLIANLTVATHRLAQELKERYPGCELKGISIHKTAQRILHNAGIDNDYHFANYVEAPTTTDLTAIFDLLVNKFAQKEYDEIHLIYTHFVNTLIQKPLTKKLLPLSLEEIISESEQQAGANEQKDTLFEPDTKTILDFLLPEYFQTQIFTALLESIASEHSARMVAMKNATDNAKELQKLLNLKYNRTRQAAITQQIIEVVNGSTQ